MKKIVLIILTFAGLSLRAQYTNEYGELRNLPPLPTELNVVVTGEVCRGVSPVAIYRYSKAKEMISFQCLGTMYQSDYHKYHVVLPMHVFRGPVKKDRETDIYAVRKIRPEADRFIGYISELKLIGESNQLDAVVADVSTNSVSALDLSNQFDSRIKEVEARSYFFFPSKTLILRGRITTSLRSLLDNKEVKILGYMNRVGARDVSDQNFGAIIEYKPTNHQDGMPFADEHGRLYLLSATPSRQETILSEENKETLKSLYSIIVTSSVAIVSGPIKLIPAE